MEPQPIEKECQDMIQDLCEREKELNFIYRIFDIIRSPQETPDLRFNEIIRAIPTGMRFPELTGVRLAPGDDRFTTEDLNESPWKLQHPIRVMGLDAGSIEIYYRKNPVPASAEPFL